MWNFRLNNIQAKHIQEKKKNLPKAYIVFNFWGPIINM